ncbi:MAG: hypothetical protein WCK41_03145 [Actinomycetes bacterium]
MADPPQSQPRSDRGAGLFGVIAGVTVFLAFLLMAVQLLVNLYAVSAVTSAAFDGAHIVAGHRFADRDFSSMQRAQTEAEAKVRAELGQFASQVTFDWSQSTDQAVALRVRGRTPRFLLPGLGANLGFDRIDRTAHVRREDLR